MLPQTKAIKFINLKVNMKVRVYQSLALKMTLAEIWPFSESG